MKKILIILLCVLVKTFDSFGQCSFVPSITISSGQTNSFVANTCPYSNYVYVTEVGMSNYNWTISSGGTIASGQGTNSISVSWTPGQGTQTISVSYTNGGCTASSPVQNIYVLPGATIIGPSAGTLGATSSYVTDANKFQYSWFEITPSNGGALLGSNTNSTNVTWSTVGLYTIGVTYNDPGGSCPNTSGRMLVNVTVAPLPIYGSTTACLGQTYYYATTTGKTSYSWAITGGHITNGSGTSSITVVWDNSGSQTLTLNYTDGSLPTVPSTLSVNVNPQVFPTPTISISGGNFTNICPGAYTLSTESGMTNYSWSLYDANNFLLANSSLSSLQTSLYAGGTFTAQVTYTNPNGCTAITPTTQIISVKTTPVPAAITGSVPSCAAGLTSTFSIPSTYSNYSWNIGVFGPVAIPGLMGPPPPPPSVSPASSSQAQILTGAASSQATIQFNSALNFQITANYYEPTSGCNLTSTLPVGLQVPSVTIQGPVPTVNTYTVCNGSSTQVQVPFEYLVLPYRYQWALNGVAIPGATSPTISANQSGNYTVTSTNSGGCSGTSNAITVNVVNPVLNSSASATICSGSIFSYTPTSSTSGASFAWTRATVSGISQLASSGGPNISETLTNTTTSSIVVTYVYTITASGCSNQQNVTVTVNPNTTITTQPSATAQSVPIGGATTALTVVAAGTAPFTYQWYVSGGLAISGATSSSFTPPSSAAGINTYYVIVTGSCGIITSANSGAVTITKLNPSLSITSPASGTYGSTIALTASTGGSTGAVSYSVANGTGTATVAGSTLTLTGAGAVVVTATVAADANYNAASTTQTVTINKAALTVTANNQSKIYGAVNPALAISYAGFKFTDNAASLTTQPTATTTAIQTSVVGSYPITPAGGVSNNYTFIYVNGTLSVTPATLTVTANNQTKVYGAVNPTLTVSYSGFVGTDNSASLTTQPTASTTATQTSVVGSYPVTPSGGVSSNYTFTYVNGTLSITAATLTVTANNQSKIYGAVNPALTVSYSGFVGTDNATSLTTQPTATTTATQASVVGSYPIAPAGGVSGNYTFNYVNGTLTVTPATLTVTANNQTKVYGTANPTLTISYAGFVGTDTPSSLTTQPTAATTATITSPVGTYPIIPAAGVSNNYTFNYVNGTLTVTKATLTVTAGNQTRVYGTGNPTFSISYSGFVGTDTPSSLTTAPTGTTAATITSPVGTYPIIPSGGVSNNYMFNYINGTLTITPASQTITFGPLASICKNTTLTLSATASSGLPVTYTSSNTAVATISGNIVTAVGAGSATITASQAGNSNYSAATSVAQSLTVNPLPTATITVSPAGAPAFCPNKSITLTASSGSSYLWSTGATTSSISVSTVGKDSVKVTNSFGCFAWSPSVQVTQAPAAPQVSIPTPSNTNICTGTVSLTASPVSSSYTYTWSDGETGSTIYPSATGPITVTLKNSSGCTTSATYTGLTRVPSNCPLVRVGAHPDLPSDPTIDTEPPTVDVLTVYPNPGSSFVTVAAPSRVAEDSPVLVYDIYGTLITSTTLKKGEWKTEMNVSSQAQGIYLVRLISGPAMSTTKLVVVK